MPAKDLKAYNAKRRSDPAYREEMYHRVRAWKLLNRYGITVEEYAEMLAGQGGHCAICPRTPEENGKLLSVDHDHETGEVRGLLCQPCNLALGHLEDHLYSVLEYLSGGD